MKPTTLERYKRKARVLLRPFRGFILYDGPSVFDGAPIRCICKTDSENRKIGPGTWQTWILRADMSPAKAYQYGAHDDSICGRCAWRARPDEKQGPCYVARWVITTIAKSVDKGNYAPLDYIANGLGLDHLETLRVLGALGHAVRLGAYGDPMAVPIAPQAALLHHASTRQCFVHSWNDERVPDKAGWQRLAMASCELPAQTVQAAAMGWRTYTAFPPELTRAQAMRAIRNTAQTRLVVAGCPASVKDSGITCDVCPIQCDGNWQGAEWHVLSKVHGARPVMAAYEKRGFLDQWQEALK